MIPKWIWSLMILLLFIPNDATFPQCMDCHQKLKNQTSSIPICSESGSMYWTNQIRSSGIAIIVSIPQSPSECCLACINEPTCFQWAFTNVCFLNVQDTCNGTLIPFPISGNVRCMLDF